MHVEAVEETRFDRDMLATRLLDELERLLKPLRHLTDDERLAIVAVAATAQLMTVYERTASRPIAPIGERFDRLIGSLHAEGGRLTAGLRKACLPESMAYVTTLAMCRREGRREDECARTTAQLAAAEMQCIMMQLEAMVGAVRRLRAPSAGG